MAVAAETIKQQAYQLDWTLAELQFLGIEEAESTRTPEAEIYGRSLSTPYRLGVFMVEKAFSEVASSPEAAQARVEFYTSVEEGFGTDVELGGGLEVRDFDERPIINGKVMSKDLKTAVSDMTLAGLLCAEEKTRKDAAKGDTRFEPQLTRTKWDHENALKVDQMARGETDYNTRIIVSPFPEEAAAASGDAYWRNIGYVPHLKRGFVQLYHVNEEGVLISGSLSFDGSNTERLRGVFHKYGIEIPGTEISDNFLQYALTDMLSEEDARALATELADEAGDPSYKKTENTVNVTHQHRSLMDMAFNDSYVHACESLARGYQTPGVRKLIFQLANKARDFNDRYAQSLYKMRANENQFTDDDMVVLHELLVYSTIEMMRALHLESGARANLYPGMPSEQTLNTLYARVLQSKNPEAFQVALSGFAAEGARNNRGYSACGLSIAAGGSDNPDNPQKAFGGADSSRNPDSENQSETYDFDVWMYCNDCQAPPEEGESKKWCGPCGLCRGCDTKQRKLQAV